MVTNTSHTRGSAEYLFISFKQYLCNLRKTALCMYLLVYQYLSVRVPVCMFVRLSVCPSICVSVIYVYIPLTLIWIILTVFISDDGTQLCGVCVCVCVCGVCVWCVVCVCVCVCGVVSGV